MNTIAPKASMEIFQNKKLVDIFYQNKKLVDIFYQKNLGTFHLNDPGQKVDLRWERVALLPSLSLHITYPWIKSDKKIVKT